MIDVKKAALAVATAGLLGLPVAASAQPVPSYAAQDEQISGTVASVDGRYKIYVRDERGFVDTVRLHDGTVINPTGLTLAAGQSVTIHGRTDGRAFDANEIDTPYQSDAGVAYDDAPDVGYVAPYSYYPYYPAYALSYPAFVSLGFGFGYGGFYGGYGYYGNGYYGRGGYGYGHGYGYGRGGYGYGHAGYGYSGSRGYGTGTRYPLGTSYGRGGSYGGYRSSGGYAHTSGAARGGGGGGFHGGGGVGRH